MKALDDGIPSISQYSNLLSSDLFKNMEEFSNKFITLNRDLLEPYASRWVADPFHQWSRQWEYPYVYSRLSESIDLREQPAILDAGSGVTFFPYFLSQNLKSSKLYCADSDDSIDGVYREINRRSSEDVNFVNCDLHSLALESNYFDAVYSISVLEHTDNYGQIIGEFRRVLKPGGMLNITFDLSIDGLTEIDKSGASRLLESLGSLFEGRIHGYRLAPSALDLSNILTTQYAAELKAELLPWQFPRGLRYAKAWLKGLGRVKWPPYQSTIFCLTLRKSVSAQRYEDTNLI